MGSSASSDEVCTVAASGSGRQKMLHDIVKEQDQDFYDMFNLDRYAEVDEHTKQKIESVYRKLALQWHPDKRRADPAVCKSMMHKIKQGKRVLMNRDLKRRYDIELRERYSEQTVWSTLGWWLSWGFSVVAVAGGVALIAVGALGAVPTGGASLAAGVVGSSLLSAGISVGLKMSSDPNCSTTELLKDIVVGAMIGAAGGGIGAAAGVAMQGASIAAKIGHAAWCGAASYAAGHVLKDAADVAITNGLVGETIRGQVSDARSNGQVFSAANGVRLLAGAGVGACAGMAVQGVVNHFAPSSSSGAGEVLDDVVAGGSQIKQKVVGKAIKGAANGAVSAARRSGEALGDVAEHAAASWLEASKGFAAKVAGLGVDTAGNVGIETSIGVVREIKAGKCVVEALRQVVPGTIYNGRVQLGLGSAAALASFIQHGTGGGARQASLEQVGTAASQCNKALLRTSEHTVKRHSGPDEQSEQCTQQKSGPGEQYGENIYSVFFDTSSADECIKLASQELLANAIDCMGRLEALIMDPDNDTPPDLRPEVSALINELDAVLGEQDITLCSPTPVGVAVKYDASSHTFSYADCNTTYCVFFLSFVTHGDIQAELVTAYPVPAADATWRLVPGSHCKLLKDLRAVMLAAQCRRTASGSAVAASAAA